jgi:NAD dependent epimerase/dehydratase
MDWTRTRVVVTGAGGFIGSHLVQRLLDLGADVTAFIRYNSQNDVGFLAAIGDRPIRIVRGDVTDVEALRRAFVGSDVAFHLAALVGVPYSFIHANQVFQVNTMGTVNVLTAARDNSLSKVVITSTSEVYGSARYVPIDEAHPKQPQSPYAASKIAADAIALSFYHAYGLPVAIVRPFNTFGPRQSDRAIIPTVIAQALSKDEIRIGNPHPTRDFTFVTDTAEGFIKAAESDKAIGQEINLGSGAEISVAALAEAIAAMVGRQVPVRVDEKRVRSSQAEVTRLLANNSRARELIGWQPVVGLEEGLRRTIEWVRENSAAYDPNAYRV